MTHKESEEFSKHNDDVEIVVGKTGVRPCEREKRGQKGKRCVGTRMLVTPSRISAVATSQPRPING